MLIEVVNKLISIWLNTERRRISGENPPEEEPPLFVYYWLVVWCPKWLLLYWAEKGRHKVCPQILYFRSLSPFKPQNDKDMSHVHEQSVGNY